MQRILLFAVPFACSTLAVAQQDASQRRVAIQAPVKDAGVYDASTGKFLTDTENAGPALSLRIYDNTCFWSQGAYFLGLTTCDDEYDEGRVPSAGPIGAGSDNTVTSFELAYCTGAVTGTVDIAIAFYETGQLGGNCAGAVPPTPGQLPLSELDLGAPMGFPLPGTTTATIPVCWTVTILLPSTFCLQSGDSGELFNWRFRQNNDDSQAGLFSSGPMLAGDPAVGAYGEGTYENAGPCGTGLETADMFWLNVDNTAVGGQPPPGCPGSPFTGTTCYWFGGYDFGNPYASFYLALDSSGECAGCDGNVQDYCTAKVNSLGCVPSLAHAGVPSASSGQPFVISSASLLNQRNTLCFYSVTGQQALPLDGGWLCVEPPQQRLQVVSSGGSPPPANDCSGSFSIDFNALIASGQDPALIAGAFVTVQVQSRDPQSQGGRSLTAAQSFLVCP